MRLLVRVIVIAVFVVFGLFAFWGTSPDFTLNAQEADPKPTPEQFDQKAAIAKLKESIKGKEELPAGEVFKNLKDYGSMPAGRLLSIMEFGFTRSLGVDCTHCHVPGDWASEAKVQKQIARDMSKMTGRINRELLREVKAFEGRKGRNMPLVNCTTCHRGAIKPALNLSK